MLKIFRPQISPSLCRQCSGIGLIAALVLVPCNCSQANHAAGGLRCPHCAGSGAIEMEVEEACPTCRGTALNRRRAA